MYISLNYSLLNSQLRVSTFSRGWQTLVAPGMRARPSGSYSISQLASLTEWDQGTLSKAVNTMVDSGLVIVKEERKGKGKPQKIVGLSEISFQLYSVVNDYLGKNLAEKKYSDDRILNEYFNMLDSSNEQMIEMAIAGLSEESIKKIIQPTNTWKDLKIKYSTKLKTGTKTNSSK